MRETEHTTPISFIDEEIEVIFDTQPTFQKIPVCPTALVWKGTLYPVQKVISERQDFRRRGKMERNMSPAHAQRAKSKGSWGVGRFYYIVAVEGKRIFEIYYDRAPKSSDDRKGAWFLLGERQYTESN